MVNGRVCCSAVEVDDDWMESRVAILFFFCVFFIDSMIWNGDEWILC